MWKSTLRITVYCSLQTIDHIIESLSPSCLDLFKEGPFAHLLNMKMTKIPLQLLAQLIRRQCVSTDNNAILFNIEGKTVGFGLQDFCLITGLNCGEYRIEDVLDTTEENESMVKQLFFRNNTSISRQELKTAFNYHCKTCSDEQELAKLANLYFLYNVLIPRQNHNILDLKHVKMLDDKEKFRSYPWGRLCYSLTKQFIQNAVKSKRKSKNS